MEKENINNENENKLAYIKAKNLSEDEFFHYAMEKKNLKDILESINNKLNIIDDYMLNLNIELDFIKNCMQNQHKTINFLIGVLTFAGLFLLIHFIIN